MMRKAFQYIKISAENPRNTDLLELSMYAYKVLKLNLDSSY